MSGTLGLMPAEAPPPLVLAREVRADLGNTRSLDAAVQRGELVRVRRGVYIDGAWWANASARDRHLALVAGTRAVAFTEPVFSHASAAALHGIPFFGEWPRHASVIGPRTGSRSRRALRSPRPLCAEEVTVLADGTRVTTLARTAIDLATILTPLGGVIGFSHVRQLGVEALEIQQLLERMSGAKGIARARATFARSFAGSESPLETLVMVRCRELGFELPEQQRQVLAVDGRRYRVDFAWLDGEILGEADGEFKYDGDDQRSPREIVLAEKRREDALRARCRSFVRITWEDAWRGDGLARRLIAAGVPRPGRPRTQLTR